MKHLSIWDTHIHLDQYPNQEIPKLIEKWQSQGIEGIIAVSMDLKTSYQLLEWKNKYSSFIHIALGYHPEQALPKEKVIIELTNLIKQEQNQLIGIGEIGLIHYRKKELGINDTTGYEELLEVFSDLGKSLNKPLILHAVHQEAEKALDILHRKKIKKAHFHWFKASLDIVKRVENAGFYISFTPEIIYRERDQVIASNFKLDQILLETDGPWPMSGPFEGKRPEPMWIKESIKKLSELKKIEEEIVYQTINKNINRLYFTE